MEYVEGELLSARVAKGPMPIREVIEVGLQVAEALDEAHGRGIVHRDIKSANLMRTERGLVKVLDFGLAKFLGPRAAAPRRMTQPQVTVAGMVVGTVSYMAPEQALGHAGRSPLRSVLARHRAVRAGNRPDAVCRHVADRDHRPHPARHASRRRRASNAAIPASFDESSTRALEKSPTFRYQSARAMQADLKDVARELDEVAPRGTASTRSPAVRAASAPRGRELGRGHDLRQHHARARRRLDWHRASPRRSAPT